MCCAEPRTGYVISVVAVTLCTFLCVCSVLLPGWTVKLPSGVAEGEEKGEEKGERQYGGLFWTCFNGSTGFCEPGFASGSTGQDVTIKLLVVVGVLFQTSGVLLALYHLVTRGGCVQCCCCCSNEPYLIPHHLWRPAVPLVEILAIGGGLIFFVGSVCAMIFVSKVKEEDVTFGPSLFLALASSALVINCGCLVSMYNRDPDDRFVFL